jgi:hypothetical protein
MHLFQAERGEHGKGKCDRQAGGEAGLHEALSKSIIDSESTSLPRREIATRIPQPTAPPPS